MLQNESILNAGYRLKLAHLNKVQGRPYIDDNHEALTIAQDGSTTHHAEQVDQIKQATQDRSKTAEKIVSNLNCSGWIHHDGSERITHGVARTNYLGDETAFTTRNESKWIHTTSWKD